MDTYMTLEEVAQALKKSGLERCDLLVGIDFTASNEENGEFTNDGRSLHEVDPDRKNPYQRVIEIVGRTLGKILLPDAISLLLFLFLSFGEMRVSSSSHVVAKWIAWLPAVGSGSARLGLFFEGF